MIHPEDIALAIVVSALLSRWAALMVGALLERWRSRRAPPAATPAGPREGWPKITVIVPAKDEERAVGRTLEAVLATDYPHLDVILVDDGSTDRTGAIAAQIAATDERVRVLRHRVNRGKAASLNHALREARTDLVITVDADTAPEPSCFTRIVAELERPSVSAVAVNVKVDARSGILGAFQSLEYVAELGVDQRALALVNGVTVVAGATAGWRRDAVLGVGGFPTETLTEDSDLTITLQRAGHGVVYRPDAVTWTRAPATLRALMKQRRRWLWGNLQTAYKHRAGLTQGPNAMRWIALPNWWFINLVVFLLTPLWLVFLPHALTHYSAPILLLIAVGAQGFEIAHCLLGHALDGEHGKERLLAPVQRLVWPFFLWVVFASVIVTRLRGRSVGWRGAPEPVVLPHERG
ncbi:MAG: glycosyltransferase [Sandaracinaceae bacterium]|nr:glycosyltransferase [Sandaracinaceae bacterium]